MEQQAFVNIQMSLFENVNREKKSIERIKMYAPIAEELTGKPFYLAYSGGKDSDTIRILSELAGIKYEAVHNLTTVDAPETVRYIKSFPNIRIEKPVLSMWKLIIKKKFPPTRIVRYCCTELKERGGENRFVMTGVRWAESVKRKKQRGSLEILTSDKRKKMILNADNDNNRMMFETCINKGKRILNPIVDWLDNEVWEFLNYYGCKSNPLYQCGYDRVGCIGCPMIGKKRLKEFNDFSKYKINYIRTFDRMLEVNKDVPYTWRSGEDVFNWWVSEKPIPRELDGQIGIDSL